VPESPVQFADFFDPGPLLDRELELVVPAHKWVDDMVAVCHDARTIAEEPRAADMSRRHFVDFLAQHPQGHQNADPITEMVPAYHFWMLIHDSPPAAFAQPPLRMAGGIGLRIGQTVDLRLYLGHIGYTVYPAFRGRHYAERSCRLLLPLARRHGMSELWITCNPDNAPSRRTCERLGAVFVDIVPLPPDHYLYLRGERFKCRYRLDLFGA